MKTTSFIIYLAIACTSTAASISTGSSYAQSFDAMGASLALPDSWRVSFSDASSAWSSGSSSVSYEASSGSPTQPGMYNFGVTSTSDRAVGLLRPTLGANNNIMLELTNSGIDSFDKIYLSFSVETYRRYNTDASLRIYYSADGATWQQSSSTPYFWWQTTSFDFANPIATSVQNSVVSTGVILPGQTFYLRWNFSLFGPNGAAAAIDDVIVSTSPIPEPAAFVGVLSLASLCYAGFKRRRKEA
jgi:hypothetical protein